MDIGIIYIITNKISGKKYIGKTTKSFNLRWNEHLCLIRKNNPKQYIHRAIKKHGIANFEIAIKFYPIKILNGKEKEYIKRLNTKFPDGYNLTDGGDGVSGWKHTEKTRKKMSKAAKGKSKPWLLGKHPNEVTKEKISRRLMGTKQSLETIKKRTEKQIGRQHNAETKLKMSLLRKQQLENNINPMPICPIQKSRHIYYFENKDGTKYTTDDFNSFCEIYNISYGSAYRIINDGIVHKNWHGYKIKKDKVA